MSCPSPSPHPTASGLWRAKHSHNPYGHSLIFRLVLSTLRPLVKTAPTRTCYRLIGGVLTERTVQDVVPTLETNFGGIKEVLESLMKTYKGKEGEFTDFQKEYGIQVSCYTPMVGSS